MHFIGRSAYWLALLAALITTGCAGNGDGLNSMGQAIGSSSSSSSSGAASSGGSSVTADFQSIQDNVFTPICSKCHIGASAPEGLQLDAAHSYNLLVGVPSVEESNLLRVKPGDPDDSYMVLKIEGASGIDGGQMPLGETPLPQSTIDAIRLWITNGAMKAQSSLAMAITAAAAKVFAVQTTAPLDQAVVRAPLRQVVVTFTHEVDASLVNTTTVSLERLVPGQAAMDSASTMDDAQSIPGIATLAEQNTEVLLITPDTALGAGVYRVRLRGTGAAALADVDAKVLDSDAAFVFTVESAQ
jgi:chloramphenicol 3-O-phosphotransferase